MARMKRIAIALAALVLALAPGLAWAQGYNVGGNGYPQGQGVAGALAALVDNVTIVYSNGVLSAVGAGVPIAISNTYTTTGTITTGDTYSLANCAASCTLTLPASGSGALLTIKSWGAGLVTVTGKIDGTASAFIVLSKGGGILPSLDLWYSSTLTSWVTK